jgi:hypothetical protein
MANRDLGKKMKNKLAFSQFNGYSSDLAAKNARDKEYKKLIIAGKKCKRAITSGYAGATIHKIYLIQKAN